MYQDPETGFFAIEHDGHRRVLACLPPTFQRRFRRFSAAYGTVPQSEWREFDLSTLARILDQNGYNSCAGHGSVSAAENSRVLAGFAPVKLSACGIYAQVNGGRDQGANVEDCGEACKLTIPTEADVPEGTIYKRQISQAAWDRGKQYAAVEVFHCGSWEEVMSAVQLRFQLATGLMVGGDWGDLDDEGNSPVASGRKMGGHCQTSGLSAFRSARYGWTIGNQNSWGPSFGRNGFSRIHKGHFDQAGAQWGQLDCYAFRHLRQGDGDPNQIPDAA